MQVLVKGAGHQTQVITKGSGLKSLARSEGRKNRASIARQAIMLLCLLHRRSLTLLDALGKDHDKPVHRWWENIERAMVVAQVHTTITIMYLLISNVLSFVRSPSLCKLLWWMRSRFRSQLILLLSKMFLRQDVATSHCLLSKVRLNRNHRSHPPAAPYPSVQVILILRIHHSAPFPPS